MDDAVAMARRGIVTLLLVAGLCGCGAASGPEPEPTPDPMPMRPETGAVKAATWRAAAAAEAAREARRQAAIRRAKASATVDGALRYALLTRRITPAASRGYRSIYAQARVAVRRLEGLRATELAAVLGTVEALAAQHLLTPTRLRPVLLVLRRNTDFWSRAAVPPAGHRVTFGRDPAVFQYYPGRGMQLQPLASWGKVNWLARTCLDDDARASRRGACPAARLRRAVDGLLALAARRGGDFPAWEHYFTWAGGSPPWISGMTQATAVSALARAARALDVPRWRRAAHAALDAFRAAPPIGVDGGDHFLMYSFAPGLRIFNGEMQAVSGIGEMAALWGDLRAYSLFQRGERGARSMVAAADTGAWSLYSFAGRESTLGYHRLVKEFLGDMCLRTRRRVYCDAHARFGRYELEPPRIAIAPLRRLHARRATTVRFSISKVSTVKVRLWGSKGLRLSRDLSLPYGEHALDWTPPTRGRYKLQIEAQGPSGPAGVRAQTFRVVLPKPKPKKKKPDEKARKPGKDRDGSTRSPEPENLKP
jgi:hypothetical protein